MFTYWLKHTEQHLKLSYSLRNYLFKRSNNKFRFTPKICYSYRQRTHNLKILLKRHYQIDMI